MPAERPAAWPPDQFASWLTTAHAMADAAGQAILPLFRRRIGVDNKLEGDGFDPVTAADRSAEQAIGQVLEARHPDHGLVGEEFGTLRGEALHRWIVDPIDGTRAFILGLPVWGTLIGLLEAQTPVLGLMDQPYTRERFWSEATASHMRDAEGRRHRLATRACPTLADAMVTTTHPDSFATPADLDRFFRIKRAARMTRYGGDCYAYCLLAAGHIDLIVESGLKPYDVMALVPIIERAGGRITTWTGGPAAEGGAIVAAGDPHLHEAAVRQLAG